MNNMFGFKDTPGAAWTLPSDVRPLDGQFNDKVPTPFGFPEKPTFPESLVVEVAYNKFPPPYTWEMIVHLFANGIERGSHGEGSFTVGFGATPELLPTVELLCTYRSGPNQPWKTAVARRWIDSTRFGYQVYWWTPEHGNPMPIADPNSNSYCACRALIYPINA